MKIVAVIEKSAWSGKFLVEVTSAELSRISGMGLSAGQQWGVGSSFGVSEAWAALQSLRQEQAEAKRAAGRLRALAELLESEVVKVEAIVEPDPTSE